ncbi:MAG: glycosyltransferase family 2 protein [Alphaproteobacteria bacterium]|nr:glycosyltransferase family 2 protein [Alphaproteobacteria bacterium]
MTALNTKISVIVPAYNEAENIPVLLEKLKKNIPSKSYEIIFVDDGSTDDTLNILKNLRKQNDCIHYLSFSRNFGHQYALRAGLAKATGDAVISIDADLQHPPEVIPQLIQKWQDGYDIVYTLRQENKNQGFLKRKTSNLYYKLLNFMTSVSVPKGAADFRLLDKKVVQILNKSPERDLFLRGYITWMGFKQIGIPYQVAKRHAGKSSYTLSKMIRLAWMGITSFSIMPLRIASVVGFLTTLLGFLYACYVVYMKIFTNHFVVTGWTSVLVSVLIIGGVQLMIMGILGEYLGLIYLETKKRPNYIIQESSFKE